MTKAKEDAIRKAAADLKTAIDEGRSAGLRVQWPHNPEGLAGIAVSEVGKPKVTTQVDAAAPVSPAVAAKANDAAQKAADKVVEKASAKS